MWRSRQFGKKRGAAQRIRAALLAFLLISLFVLQMYQPADAGVTSWSGIDEVTALSSGDSHACAIAGGKAYCWGSGASGQLGNNSTSQSNVPVAVYTSGVLSGKTVTAISAGSAHTCAVADGAAYCWGLGTSGRLGNNSTSQSNVPVAVNTAGVLSGKNLTAISAGNAHTCAVADGAGYCWGNGTSGKLGHNSTGDSTVPVAVNTAGVLSGKTVTAISAGVSHSCAVASATAYCWGVGTSGRLGNNDTTSSSVPVAVYASGVLSGKTITGISAGSAHSCAVGSGAAYCWGLGSNGRLGNNDTTQSNVPVAVSTAGVLSSKTVTAISAGTSHSCAIANSTAYCWGLASSGQLGNNDTTDSLVPIAVQSLATPLNTSPYRLYQNANSATPGAALAAANSTPKLSSPGDTFRLRQGINSGTGFTAVSAGGSHSCAVANSKAYCWGVNTYGQLGNGSTLDSAVPVAVDTSGVLSGKTVTAVSAGSSHTCAIADSKAYCWGFNLDGQLGNNNTSNSSVPVAVDTSGVLSGKTVTDISVSDNSNHACVVADGAAYCWGTGANGRLGRNSLADSLVPVAVDTSGVLSGKTVTDIAAGTTHTCVVADGAAYCWGLGTNGRLGNNSTSQSLVPVAVNTAGVLSGKTVTAISAGDSHSCAVASSVAYCWGAGANGRLGNSSISDSLVPVAVTASGVLSGKTVTDIAAGTTHSCAVASSAAYCWGLGTNGRLGNNSTSQSLVPVAVNTAGVLSGKTVTAISAGTAHSCAIASGAAYCWGIGTNSRLGNNSTVDSSVPVTVDTAGALSGKTVTAISSGVAHSCAVADGAAYCWGSNASGQLGNNSTSDSLVPVAVDTTGVLSGKTVTAISAGDSHTCVAASGAAYCWGLGANGRLGRASLTDSSVPVTVTASPGALSGKTVTDIAAGTAHSCAVASGVAYCWGLGTNGRLGNNSTSQSLVPVAVTASGVLSGKTVTAISAGDAHSCAIASSAAYCWGTGTSGRLGNNSTSDSLVPVAVDTSGVLSGKTVTAISAGTSHTCAVASAVAYCWGVGTSGRLGNNSTSSSSVPVAVNTAGVLSGKTVTAISAGSAHSCAAAGNTSYCWGLGSSGRLGNNDTAQSSVPVVAYTAGALNGKTLTAVSAGTSHSCAIASGAAYCWGLGTSGRLGGNSTADSSVAVPVYAKGYMVLPRSTIVAGATTFVLQYAALSAATCSAQTTGFAAVTTSTPIAYSTNAGVANGAAISTNSNDPTDSSITTAQTYRSDTGTFTTASDILPGYTGLFDFSLKDNGATPNARYCLRMAYGSGSAIESAAGYVEIIMANGVLVVEIVDGSSNTVPSPSFTMNTTVVKTSCQQVSGVFGTSTQRVRIYNTLSSTGWAVNIAATSGPTSAWTSAGPSYDFNDPSGSPSGCNSGSDGDGIAGRFSLNPSVSTITPSSGCSTTGLSKGGSAGFSQGAVDAITLLTASSLTPTSCYYHITDVGMSQYIPASQPAGNYTITMTVTVVAQ